MENQANIICPFCKSELEHDALVCHKCNAVKGVGYSLLTKRLISKEKAKSHLMIFGIPYAVAVLVILTTFNGQGPRGQGGMGFVLLCILYALFMAIPVARFIGLSLRDERWFR